MDETKPNVTEKANADEIKDSDATEAGPRGNVHSEPGPPAPHEAPPPLPN